MNNSANFVNARTCTLVAIDGQHSGLLDGQTYIIPVYQRPIAWKIEQIQRLLDGIWAACKSEEPYFIGTLLLIPRNEHQSEWEVVDGQQRLTTILLLTHVAKWQYGEAILPESLRNAEWLRTQVSSQQQQQWLKEVLALTNLPTRTEEAPQNPYLRNAFYLYDWLEEQDTQQGEDSPSFEPDKFFNYLAYSVHAVVIETRAGLAKALDIFNTINTTGLPLTGDDLFKIQLYDYLTRINPDQSDSAKQRVLERIDEFYADIIARNKLANDDFTSPSEILGIYQRILIERAEANRTLHELSPASFFERVFAVLLLNRTTQRFDKVKMAAALGTDPLADLTRLVEMRQVWENQFSNRHEISDALQGHTRYWRFNLVDLIYLFRFYGPTFEKYQFELWKELLVKFYIVKTLEAAKIVNEGRTFTYQAIRLILRESSTPDDVVGQVRKKLAEYPHKEWLLENVLMRDVYENRARRDLTSRLSALLAQEPDWRNGWHDSTAREQILGKHEYEVEHIHPRNPAATFEGNAELEHWGNHQNTLGNLTLLEWEINRKVLNHPLSKKREGYQESKLSEVLALIIPDKTQEISIGQHSYWSVAQCEKRTRIKADLIAEFLFNESKYLS